MAAFLHVQRTNHLSQSIKCKFSLNTHCARSYSKFQVKFACNNWTVISSILNSQSRTYEQSRAIWRNRNQSTLDTWGTLVWKLVKLCWFDWATTHNYSMQILKRINEVKHFIVEQYFSAILDQRNETSPVLDFHSKQVYQKFKWMTQIKPSSQNLLQIWNSEIKDFKIQQFINIDLTDWKQRVNHWAQFCGVFGGKI